MELKVESELVLKAAKESPRDDVRKALKTMFPEAFEEETTVSLADYTMKDVKLIIMVLSA